MKFMSRIGKRPIEIPSNVEIVLSNQGEVKVKGPLGELKENIRPEIKVRIDGSVISVQPVDENPDDKARAFWGLSRTLIANMIEGVTKGFEKKLEINGIGYKADLVNPHEIKLSLGYSHPINFKSSEEIQLETKKNIITIKGIKKSLVGQVAAKIRLLRKPEPYKGKGIKYVDEVIRMKEVKKSTGKA